MPEKTTDGLGGGKWRKVNEDCDWVDVSDYLTEIEVKEPVCRTIREKEAGGPLKRVPKAVDLTKLRA